MNPLLRWARFNLVGAVGMVVQLATLAAFSRCDGGHYLVATAAAIEITLLHNFIGHLRYTWRDRRGGSNRLQQLVRFHSSNGAVSLLGNLVLMRWLVGEARMPVLAANAIAIVACSLVNFCLGDRWVFTAGPAIPPPGRRLMRCSDQ